jgi:hypothetical protein
LRQHGIEIAAPQPAPLRQLERRAEDDQFLVDGRVLHLLAAPSGDVRVERRGVAEGGERRLGAEQAHELPVLLLVHAHRVRAAVAGVHALAEVLQRFPQRIFYGRRFLGCAGGIRGGFLELAGDDKSRSRVRFPVERLTRFPST